jgi:hypothetical protein
MDQDRSQNLENCKSVEHESAVRARLNSTDQQNVRGPASVDALTRPVLPNGEVESVGSVLTGGRDRKPASLSRGSHGR